MSRAEAPRSFGERIRKVPCPRSVRARHDDQIVELFLRVWQDGRFTRNIHWLPQDRTNVEVIAADRDNVCVAIEHTRLFAYENHKRQEEALRPLAEALEAAPQLKSLNRRFDVRFQGNYLGKLLLGFQRVVTEQLRIWAIETLPSLEKRDEVYRFEVPISLSNGKKPIIPVDINVSEPIEGVISVSVGGYLPADQNRFVPVVRKALAEKLLKLTVSAADLRILLFELPIINETPSNVIGTLGKLGSQFPKLQDVNYFVIAKTIGYETEDYLLYWVWNQSAKDWSDIIQPVLEP
jgi:hypothetical protein